jgi:hypothetical protein
VLRSSSMRGLVDALARTSPETARSQWRTSGRIDTTSFAGKIVGALAREGDQPDWPAFGKLQGTATSSRISRTKSRRRISDSSSIARRYIFRPIAVFGLVALIAAGVALAIIHWHALELGIALIACLEFLAALVLTIVVVIGVREEERFTTLKNRRPPTMLTFLARVILGHYVKGGPEDRSRSKEEESDTAPWPTDPDDAGTSRRGGKGYES